MQTTRQLFEQLHYENITKKGNNYLVHTHASLMSSSE